MTRLTPLALALALAASPALAQSVGTMPDPLITPGAVRSTDFDEICRTPTAGLRFMPRERADAVLIRYGLPPGAHPNYEIDHLVPLCLGGSDDDANLWPQPRRSIAPVENAERKDRLEARVCQLVCANEVDIVEAQRDIADDWIAAYDRYVGKGDD
jgi:hypothetical protein